MLIFENSKMNIYIYIHICKLTCTFVYINININIYIYIFISSEKRKREMERATNMVWAVYFLCRCLGPLGLRALQASSRSY